MFPILVGLVIPYLLIGVMASGTVMQSMTSGAFPELFPHVAKPLAGGIPTWLGSLVICGVVLIYVFFGGMRGTAWANAFQTIVFMVLGVVTFFVIATTLGKGALIHDARQQAMAAATAAAEAGDGVAAAEAAAQYVDKTDEEIGEEIGVDK